MKTMVKVLILLVLAVAIMSVLVFADGPIQGPVRDPEATAPILICGQSGNLVQPLDDGPIQGPVFGK